MKRVLFILGVTLGVTLVLASCKRQQGVSTGTNQEQVVPQQDQSGSTVTGPGGERTGPEQERQQAASPAGSSSGGIGTSGAVGDDQQRVSGQAQLDAGGGALIPPTPGAVPNASPVPTPRGAPAPNPAITTPDASHVMTPSLSRDAGTSPNIGFPGTPPSPGTPTH